MVTPRRAGRTHHAQNSCTIAARAVAGQRHNSENEQKREAWTPSNLNHQLTSTYTCSEDETGINIEVNGLCVHCMRASAKLVCQRELTGELPTAGVMSPS